ncbi:hypothetical protein U9M48_029582 [Paspalum notatum var. saurae]|uniref:Transposase (putative) gypsy type domain-containing protein n=1 Tax=Paspalum notatum var. saurae TaxID=547442 RepID=A0AAQ3U3M7_PASNO
MVSSSSSSVQIIDPTLLARAPDTSAADTGDNDDDDVGANARSWPSAERVTSLLRSQRLLDNLCERHGVDTKAFTPLRAGDLRSCSPPPEGAVCVYAEALEAGMRVPLHPFFCEVLAHFGVAPSQLAPNCWRFMAAFIALSRSAGVHPPSLPVFLHFFSLRTLKFKGVYCFASKDTAGVLFTGLPDYIKGWKERFFFLKSSAPWPCPVLWGEPTKKSTADPVLTSEEKSVAARLLRVRGAAVIDFRTYLTDGTFAAAMPTTTPPAPNWPPPPPSSHPTSAKGMDPSLYAMLQDMRAEKAAAEAAAAAAAAKVSVKTEPGGSDTPLSGTKRKLAEDKDAKEGDALFRSGVKTRAGAAAHGFAPTPPGFRSAPQDRKPQHAPDRHDDDSVDWEEARRRLQSIVTPSRERAFLVANPSTVIAASYVATLQVWTFGF